MRIYTKTNLVSKTFTATTDSDRTRDALVRLADAANLWDKDAVEFKELAKEPVFEKLTADCRRKLITLLPDATRILSFSRFSLPAIVESVEKLLPEWREIVNKWEKSVNFLSQ